MGIVGIVGIVGIMGIMGPSPERSGNPQSKAEIPRAKRHHYHEKESISCKKGLDVVYRKSKTPRDSTETYSPRGLTFAIDHRWPLITRNSRNYIMPPIPAPAPANG